MSRFTIRRMLVVTLYVAAVLGICTATGFPDWWCLLDGLTWFKKPGPSERQPETIVQGVSLVTGMFLSFPIMAMLFVGTPMGIVWVHIKLWNWSAYREE